jgi:probable HAF family extracellular repeat protein
MCTPRVLGFSAIVGYLLFWMPGAFAAVQYTLTDLGTLGGQQSVPYGISPSGQVVGKSSVAGDSTVHAFRYFGGTMQDLGVLPGTTSSVALGINADGQIVGYSPGNLGEEAFVYDATGMHDIGSGRATAINGHGVAVGYTAIAGFVYDGTTRQNVSGGYNYAYGINGNGQIVGRSDLTGHAFSYQYPGGGSPQDLGPGTKTAVANNDNGVIVGTFGTHGFLFSGGIVNDLGTVTPMGINAGGQVVGTTDQSRAFLYDAGTFTDLNSLIDPNLGWVLSSANAINDAGQIVVYGYGPGFINGHAALLTPVGAPEPAGLALALPGIALAMRPRKR